MTRCVFVCVCVSHHQFEAIVAEVITCCPYQFQLLRPSASVPKGPITDDFNQQYVLRRPCVTLPGFGWSSPTNSYEKQFLAQMCQSQNKSISSRPFFRALCRICYNRHSIHLDVLAGSLPSFVVNGLKFCSVEDDTERACTDFNFQPARCYCVLLFRFDAIYLILESKTLMNDTDLERRGVFIFKSTKGFCT